MSVTIVEEQLTFCFEGSDQFEKLKSAICSFIEYGGVGLRQMPTEALRRERQELLHAHLRNCGIYNSDAKLTYNVRKDVNIKHFYWKITAALGNLNIYSYTNSANNE